MTSLADESIFTIYRDAVDNFSRGVFVELGCFQGASTIYLAKLIKDAGKSIVIYAVDKWENSIAPGVEGSIFHEFWGNVMIAGVEQFIRPIQADSADAAKLFADGSVDFCFIDADHSYNGFKRDLEGWFPKIKSGGWIGGHDYNQDVQRVCHDILIDKMGMVVERVRGEKIENDYFPGDVVCVVDKGANSWLTIL